MTPLFSKGNLILLESLAFTRTLYAFDFDGTLARIVSDPAAARMSKKTASLLRELSKVAIVGIVSGRSVRDLRSRLHFKPSYLVGNHGLEGLSADAASLEKAESLCRRWLEALTKEKFGAGVEIENKRFSLALHYRRSRHRKAARKQIITALSRLTPAPRVIEGKLVYNLLPPGAPHKGAAILDLMHDAGVKHAFYVGDDDTDEDVFSLPRESGDVLTVRVGRKKSSRAHYFIRGQADIDRLLEMLVRFHAPEKQGGRDA